MSQSDVIQEIIEGIKVNTHRQEGDVVCHVADRFDSNQNSIILIRRNNVLMLMPLQCTEQLDFTQQLENIMRVTDDNSNVEVVAAGRLATNTENGYLNVTLNDERFLILSYRQLPEIANQHQHAYTRLCLPGVDPIYLYAYEDEVNNKAIDIQPFIRKVLQRFFTQIPAINYNSAY